MCGGIESKLGYRERLWRRKKEEDGGRKNAKCPALFCLIDPIGPGDFLLGGRGIKCGP